MLKLKRFLILVLVSAMLLSCYGCGNDVPTEGTNTTGRQEQPSSQSNNTETSAGKTEPSEDTNKPSEGTKPTQETEPPVTNPHVTDPKPTNPPATESPVTNPPVTGPPVTNPPETEHPEVIQPTTYPTEPEDNGYKGVTPETLSEETVKDWDVNDYNQFKWKYWDEMSYQERYDFLVLSQNNGTYYRCGADGHYCVTPMEHETRINFICIYCGQTDCAGWYQAEDLTNGYHCWKCPEYNIFKDPMEYCQTCGNRGSILGVTSIIAGCKHNVMGGPCHFCGEYLRAFECHTCKRENLKPEFEQYIISTPTPTVLEYSKSYIEAIRNATETPQDQFTFENIAGGVMITGYLGSNEIVVFPKTISGQPVVQLKDRFFPEDSNVKAVWIPDSVKVLNQTFSHNTTIQAVICEGVETIMPGAFYGCYSLQEVVLGKNFNNLDHLAFYDCISLVKLIEPSESSIFTISGGELIFHGCDRLTIYTDPNSALALFVQSNNLNIKVESLNSLAKQRYLP